MMEFYNNRRTEYPAGFHNDSTIIDVNIDNPDIARLVKNIFKSYKENSFDNNKHLNLLRTYLLLQNISQKNGEFVQTLIDKKKTVVKDIKTILQNLVDDGDVNCDDIGGFDVLFENYIKIFYDILEKYKTDLKDTTDIDTNAQYDVNAYIKAKLEKLEKNVWSDGGTEDKIDDTIITSYKEFGFAIQQISHNFSNIIEQFNRKLLDVTSIGFTGNVDNTYGTLPKKKTSFGSSLKIIDTIFVKIQKKIVKLSFNVNNTLVKVNKKQNSIFERTNKIMQGIFKHTKTYLNKLISRISFGSIKNIVVGIVKKPFRIISNVFSNIKTSVVQTTKNIMNKMKNPVLEILKAALLTVPGAFIAGWFIGKIVGGFKNFANDIKESFGGVKKFVDNIGDKSSSLFNELKLFIYQIKRNKKVVESLVNILHGILDSFTPEGMLKSAGLNMLSSGITGTVMWGIGSLFTKAAMSTGPYGWLVLAAVGAAIWGVGKLMENIAEQRNRAILEYTDIEQLEETKQTFEKMLKVNAVQMSINSSVVQSSRNLAKVFKPSVSNATSSGGQDNLVQSMYDFLSKMGDDNTSIANNKIWMEFIDKKGKEIQSEISFLAGMVDKENIEKAIKNGSIFQPKLTMFVGSDEIKTLKGMTDYNPITLRLINLKYQLELLKQNIMAEMSEGKTPEDIFNEKLQNLFKIDLKSGSRKVELADTKKLSEYIGEEGVADINKQLDEIVRVDLQNTKKSAEKIFGDTGGYAGFWSGVIKGSLADIGTIGKESLMSIYNVGQTEQYETYQFSKLNSQQYNKIKPIILLFMVSRRNFDTNKVYSFSRVFIDIFLDKMKSDNDFFSQNIQTNVKSRSNAKFFNDFFNVVLMNKDVYNKLNAILNEDIGEKFWFEPLLFKSIPSETTGTGLRTVFSHETNLIFPNIDDQLQKDFQNYMKKKGYNNEELGKFIEWLMENKKLNGIPVVKKYKEKYSHVIGGSDYNVIKNTVEFSFEYKKPETEKIINDIKTKIKEALRGVLKIFESIISNGEKVKEFEQILNSENLEATFGNMSNNAVNAVEDILQHTEESSNTSNMVQIQEHQQYMQQVNEERRARLESVSVDRQYIAQKKQQQEEASNGRRNGLVANIGDTASSSIQMGRSFVYS